MKAVKTTNKATKQAHQYQLDTDGFPYPIQLKDLPPQNYGYGNLSGLALVVDLFQWRDALTGRQVDGVSEFVRMFMEDAVQELDTPFEESKLDRRGVAVGVLEGLAAMVAHALESKSVRDFMVKHLSKTAQYHEVMAAKEAAKELTKALDVHGLAHGKGGPRHE